MVTKMRRLTLLRVCAEQPDGAQTGRPPAVRVTDVRMYRTRESDGGELTSVKSAFIHILTGRSYGAGQMLCNAASLLLRWIKT